jgi:hypothetical protein
MNQIRYVKSSHWDNLKADDAVYLREKKGLLMIKDGYVYTQKNVAMRWINWRCRFCDASCRIKT